MLFQLDLTSSRPQEVFDEFWKEHEADATHRSFAEQLVLGVHAAHLEIDRMIAASAENWRMERMAVVDRNVLRVAVYEMLNERATPAAVVIDVLERSLPRSQPGKPKKGKSFLTMLMALSIASGCKVFGQKSSGTRRRWNTQAESK